MSGLSDAMRELATLKAWKESAMAVTPPMQEIAKVLGVRLGASIHDKILPGIVTLQAELAECHAEIARLKVEQLEERTETGEAWEQLAATFPAIQVDCEDQLKAAALIVDEHEEALAQYALMREERDACRLRFAWVPVSAGLPEHGLPVLGFSPDWVHEDFCPAGVRECHVVEGEWASSVWAPMSDVFCTDEASAPTHWMLMPAGPAASTGGAQ